MYQRVMKARTLIQVSARISAYQRVYHERSDTLIHRISDMYQKADTYQWDMMRLQDGAYVSGVYQRVKKHPS